MTDLYTEEFNRFYEAYPRKVAKMPAAKAFAKLSPEDQIAARLDVEKRTRANWWSADPKKIPHAATFLNAHRFEDDWSGDMKVRFEAGPQAPRRSTYEPDPRAVKDRWTIFANRVCFRWLMEVGGVDNTDSLAIIKNQTVDEMRDALDEEIAAGNKREAALLMADTLLLRLDQTYKRNKRDKVMASAAR